MEQNTIHFFVITLTLLSLCWTARDNTLGIDLDQINREPA